MPYSATAQIMGHVGKYAAETRTTKSGKSVTTLGVSVKNWGKDADGKPTYSNYRVQTWNADVAERLKNAQEWDLILVTGRLEIQRYKDKDGNQREQVIIDASSFENITAHERYRASQGVGNQGGDAAPQAETAKSAAPAASTEDDLPF